MIDINELRRLAQTATPGPWHATKSVETNSWAVWSDTTRLMELRPTKTVDMYQVSNTAAFIAAANPAAISELLGRLEAAESDGLEQARLLGMSGEREAALLAKLEAAEKERDALRAKITEMEKHEPVAWLHETRRDSDVVTDAVKHVWGKAAVGSMAAYSIPLYAHPGAQPTPSDEYVGWYCAHCERGVDASEVTYHEQHQVCGRIITDDKPPKPAPSASEGWLRAIDDALVSAHIGVANADDTYEQAKAKLDNLIGFHVDVATDPAVNGGWKLVPIEPTEEMIRIATAEYVQASSRRLHPNIAWRRAFQALLAAAPEAKP